MDTVLLNLAYLGYVSASLLPGGLKLRIGLVVQSAIFMSWAVATETWSALFWNIAFTGVNIFQAIRDARRNSVKLTEEEERMHDELFADLSRRDFLLLWSTGQEHQCPAGKLLCEEGTRNLDLLLVVDGDVEVSNDSGLVRSRSALTFIGEMSYFSGDAASADVVSTSALRYRRWSQDDLRAMRQLNPACLHSMQDALGRDVAYKLRT